MSNVFVGNNQAKKIYLGSTLLAEVKEEQTKSVTIQSNGVTTITPDAGKTLSSVSVNTAVSGGGGLLPGNAVYFKPAGTGNWVRVGIDWVTDHYESEPATQPRFIVAVTSDTLEPNADLSNVTLYVAWISGSTFGISISTAFTSSIYGDAPLMLTV